MTAQRLGELDPEDARPARPAVDEDPVPALDVRHDGLVGRQPRHAHGGRIDGGDALGDSDRAGGSRDGELAEGATGQRRGPADTEDELAGLERGVGCRADNRTDEVKARRGGFGDCEAGDEGDWRVFEISIISPSYRDTNGCRKSRDNLERAIDCCIQGITGYKTCK